MSAAYFIEELENKTRRLNNALIVVEAFLRYTTGWMLSAGIAPQRLGVTKLEVMQLDGTVRETVDSYFGENWSQNGRDKDIIAWREIPDVQAG
jgi:hypothetical protein